MNILFLISHQPNPRFVKQLNYTSKEHNTVVIYFERANLANINKNIAPEVEQINAGEIQSVGSYASRIIQYIKSLNRLIQLFKIKNYDKVIVNNLDTLVLAAFCRFYLNQKFHIVIEISDLREFVFSSSSKAIILRKLEVFLYKKYVDKLIVTSPKYYEYHFHHFFDKTYFVLENKPLSSMLPERNMNRIESSKRVTIGIVGMLIRGDEYEALFEAFKDSDDIDIKIFGKGKYEFLVKEYAAKHNNIIYYGEYDFFKDAAKIYSSIDMIYIVYDTENGSMNNKLALPNKLYEAMFFGVPIIASKGTFLEERINKFEIGYNINFRCTDELKRIPDFYRKNKDKLQNNFKNIPEDEYLADNDYQKFLKLLEN